MAEALEDGDWTVSTPEKPMKCPYRQGTPCWHLYQMMTSAQSRATAEEADMKRANERMVAALAERDAFEKAIALLVEAGKQ